jgi:hypothetical protein
MSRENPLEKQIEAKVRQWCKENKYLFYKFTSPACRNVPDRICIAPNGTVGFMELKRKGNKPSPGQAREMFKLFEQNCKVTWIDNYEDAIKFLRSLQP